MERISAFLTSGGKQSSAARRGTEKPPCVLVSEAVRVLQNMCGVDFVGGPPTPSSPPSSSSSLPSDFIPTNYNITQNQQKKEKEKPLRNTSSSSSSSLKIYLE